MKTFQDRICNLLTLLGLIAVISGGIYSLIPKHESPQTDISELQNKPTIPDNQSAPCKDSLSVDSLESIQEEIFIATEQEHNADTLNKSLADSIYPTALRSDSIKQQILVDTLSDHTQPADTNQVKTKSKNKTVSSSTEPTFTHKAKPTATTDSHVPDTSRSVEQNFLK